MRGLSQDVLDVFQMVSMTSQANHQCMLGHTLNPKKAQTCAFNPFLLRSPHLRQFYFSSIFTLKNHPKWGNFILFFNVFPAKLIFFQILSHHKHVEPARALCAQNLLFGISLLPSKHQQTRARPHPSPL